MAFVYHHVFCDESGKYDQDPLIAFCAVTATGDRLAAFDREWRALLRSYEIPALHMKVASRLLEDCGYRFRKGQTLEERTEALYPFSDCINKYLERGIIQAWDVRGFNHLPHAVLMTLGGSRDPYFLAFASGLTHIVDTTAEDDRISIIFDDDPHTAWDCYCHFRSVGKAKPEVAKKAVAVSFGNDKHFPALQAADMVSFLAKHEANEQFNHVPNMWRDLYGRLVTEPRPPYGIMRWEKMFADEEQLVQFGREAREASERLVREREEARNRLRKIQPDDGAHNPGSAPRGGGEVARGKAGRKSKNAQN
jgi:hypothetical protein